MIKVKKVFVCILFLISIRGHASFKEVWGRYFFANNISGELDLITNLDLTLDSNNTNESYLTLRSLFFFQVGKGWFLDVGPAYRGDFGSNITYREFRIIGSVHYINNVEDWVFRNRLRLENRWIKEGPKGEEDKTSPFRFRLRVLFQKNNLVNLGSKTLYLRRP